MGAAAEKIIAIFTIYMPALFFLIFLTVRNGLSAISLTSLLSIGLLWFFPMLIIWFIVRLTGSRYFIITALAVISFINIFIFQFFLAGTYAPDGSMGVAFLVSQIGVIVGTIISLMIIKYMHIQKVGVTILILGGMVVLSIFSLNQLFTLIA